MMRVLMTTDAVGGVWAYALELATALRVEVVLAVLGPAPDPDQRADEPGEKRQRERHDQRASLRRHSGPVRRADGASRAPVRKSSGWMRAPFKAAAELPMPRPATSARLTATLLQAGVAATTGR